MKEMIAFAHVLADATRCRIVQLVADEALCVCELADILGMPQSSVSSHIQVIRKAGLLDSERCEKWVYYRLALKSRSALASLREHFSESLESDTKLARDAKRAEKRLAQREKSCCPGPKALAYAGSACEPKVISH